MPTPQPPLRLIYEPDDYLCTWTIPDRKGGIVELPGDLEVRPNQPPRGSIYGSVPLQLKEVESGGVSASFPQIVDVPVLSGTLANGGSVVLLDASIEYWSVGRGHISGSAALLGKGDAFFGWKTATREQTNDTPLISSVKFQISSLDAILGSAPIKSVTIPEFQSDNRTDLWSAKLNRKMTGEWESGGVALSVGFDGRMRVADAYQFRLAFSPVATLSLDQGVPLRIAVDDFIEPLRRITSIATGESQDLTYVAVEIEGRQGRYQVFGTGITQRPFESSSETIRKKRSAVRAKPDELSLLDLVLKWRQYTSDHHPLVETYGAMLHARDQHPRSRFLLLIQALEGLYGHETKEEYDTRKVAHLAKRKGVLECVQDKLDPESIKFLKDSLLKNPPTNLETALRAMVSGLPVDTMGRLAATPLVQEAMADPAAPTTPASALRVVRNNLAHGKRGYDTRMLDEAVRILELIVRGHSLRILGCPDHVVARVFEED